MMRNKIIFLLVFVAAVVVRYGEGGDHEMDAIFSSFLRDLCAG